MNRGLLGFLFVLCSMTAMAQREIDPNDKGSFADRMYLGGGIGLSGGTDGYGNKYFYLGLYPIIGYMVNDKLSVGTSLTYQYYNYPDVNYSISQYGFAPFVRYNLGQLFLYSEYMILNSPTYDPTSGQRRTYNRWLMGAGYSQPLGKRSSINVMGLYDVIYNQSDRVFTSPWVFRVFFSF